MFSKTDFNPSNYALIQHLSEFPSLRKKKKSYTIGKKKILSSDNSNSPKIFHHLLFMMGLLLLQALLTMATYVQAPSKMLSVDMHLRPNIMFLVDLVGIATGFL